MALIITTQDTKGKKGTLKKAQLAYDAYEAGGDEGRMWIGTANGNVAIAKKSEVDAAMGKSDVVTALELDDNTLKYTDETNTITEIDLSKYLDGAGRTRITESKLDTETGVVTFSRDDDSSFTLDLSALYDDTKVNVVDELSSDEVESALSAKQGKVLDTKVEVVDDRLTDTDHKLELTTADVVLLQQLVNELAVLRELDTTTLLDTASRRLGEIVRNTTDNQMYISKEGYSKSWYQIITGTHPLRGPGYGEGSSGVWTETFEVLDTVLEMWKSPQTISNEDEEGYWVWHTGSTASSSTGPDGAAEGDYYLYTESSGDGADVDFILETNQFAKLTKIEFKLCMYGKNTGTFTVEYWNPESSEWKVKFTLEGNQGEGWLDESIDMTDVLAEKIRFRHNGISGSRGDLALDKIVFTSID